MMGKSRLEAFSDGVLAIIITIMVLELKIPAGDDLTALTPLIPVFLSYVLSFAYVGIYWNNHHHMLQASRRVTGGVLLANLNLLFWLSLLPFATAWIGRNHYARVPGILYGGVLLASALAYWILQQVIILSEGESSTLARAVGSDWKGKASLMAYTIAIAVTFVSPIAAQIIYAGVALLWLIPDRRIETHLQQNG
ncbi:MAG: TMEM175 family protein [Planctomycetaceae bacterium]